MKKIATNLTQSLSYTTIESIQEPQTVIAMDSEGNRFTVSAKAAIGDVLVFADNTDQQPILMSLESFKVGRSI
jgi:hypothetical protein